MFERAQVWYSPTVDTTLQSIRDAGVGDIHIIADFDMTLTKHWIDTPLGPERNLSSHGVLERGPAVSKEFARKTEAVAKHYYPYEVSDLPIPQKTALMVEWWTKAHTLIIEEKITRSQVRQQAVAAKLTFREGVREFIDLTVSLTVPVLIFSAGIAEVIESLLEVNALSRENQVVVSNRVLYTDDVITGFAEPLIHVLNKGEHAIPGIAKTLEDRKSVVLLGDSLGDSNMADGVEHSNILKIGYCNFGYEGRVQQFKDKFDVVITGDIGLDWIIDVLKWLDAGHA